MQKHLWESKTVWLNIITFLSLVFVAAPHAGLFDDYALRVIAYLNVILNIALRVWFTNSGIKK